MKKLFILFLLFPLFIHGQKLDLSDGYFQFNSPVKKNTINAIIVIGQSNAVGKGNPATSPSWTQGDQPSYVYNDAVYEIYNPEIDSNGVFPNFTGRKESYGVEMAIQYRYNQVSGDTLYILKYALSGTRLAVDVTADWNVVSNQYYDFLKDHIDSTIYYIEDTLEKNINWLGVVWYQGETDMTNQTWANAYGVNLYNFINGVRGHIGEPLLPWYEVRIDPTSVAYTSQYPSTVHEAIDSVASVLPGVFIIDADSNFYDYNSDSVHLSGTGLLDMGNKISDMILGDVSQWALVDNVVTNQTSSGVSLNIAVQDTTVAAIIGRIVFKESDSTFYGCRSTVASQKWYPLN